MLPAPCKWRSAKASGSLCVGGLQGGAPVAASWKPFSHGHARLQAEQFRAESGGIRHEAVRGADAERGVVVPGSTLSEIDHHVFVQGRSHAVLAWLESRKTTLSAAFF